MDAHVPLLAPATIPVLRGAHMNTGLCGSNTPRHARRAKALILRTPWVSGRTGLSLSSDAGLACPSIGGIPVRSHRASCGQNTARLPVERFKKPSLQLLSNHDPRNSLKSRVLRGSLEPAEGPGAPPRGGVCAALRR